MATPRSDLWYIGRTYPILPTLTLDAQLLRSYDNRRSKATLAALQARYQLSKRSAVYATVGHTCYGGSLCLSVNFGAVGITRLPGGARTGFMPRVRPSPEFGPSRRFDQIGDFLVSQTTSSRRGFGCHFGAVTGMYFHWSLKAQADLLLRIGKVHTLEAKKSSVTIDEEKVLTVDSTVKTQCIRERTRGSSTWRSACVHGS